MRIVPAYTIPQSGPATRAAVDRFLAAPRLMRLGVTEPDGTPLVHPVWYTWEQEQFLLHIPTRRVNAWPLRGNLRYISPSTIRGLASLECGAKPEQPLILIGSGCARRCRTNGTGIPEEVTPRRAASCWAWSRQATSFWLYLPLAIWPPGDYRRCSCSASRVVSRQAWAVLVRRYSQGSPAQGARRNRRDDRMSATRDGAPFRASGC